ncbi:MAG: hypothetical protein ACFBSG_01395 [Leptolyngbyaceae cyanobacterium]
MQLSNGWKITIDAVRNSKNIFSLLEEKSGFGVTHIGKIEKEDGGFFTSDEALSILDAICWYCSFSVGRWTGPCLPFGFDQNDNPVWQMWDFYRIDPFRKDASWLGWGSRRHIFEEPFQGFMKLWLDENWKEVIQLAIYRYVDANSSVSSIEGSVVLAQVALELLASAILVENYALLSKTKYSALSASNKIRELFL